MSRRFRFAIASLSVGVLLGCGGGSATHPDAGGGDASGGSGGFHGFTGTGNTLGTGNTTGTGNTAGSTTGTAGSSITGVAGSGTGTGGAAGAPMPTGSLVFQGNLAALVNGGPPCTGEDGATGDRWCAFFAPLGTYPGDLYVVNVTKAAAGTSITCGLADPNCLHLTGSFTQDDPTVSTFHQAMFQGDTLIYYDATWTPYAWRPGMTAGRALATADPTMMDVGLCLPSLKGTAVMCLRILPDAMQTDPTNTLLVDLLAGKVDGTAEPPLARVETVIAASSSDTNVNHFTFDFPVPGSDVIAWSARATRTGAEVLKMQTIGDDAGRVTVASGVNSWRVSPDGARWYWLSGVNETSGAGALQSAPYPAGTTPTAIAANTAQFGFPTPSSLVTFDTARNLRGYANPATAPTTATSLDTGVAGLIALSLQGHVGYAKATSSTTSGLTLASMFVKKVDGTGACTITSTTNGYPPDFFFSPDSGAVSWIQVSGTTIQARYTRLSDCTATTVDASAGLVFAQPFGNRGLMFLDGYDGVSGTGALQVRNVAAGNTPSTDPLSMISGRVGAFATLASGGTDIVVYTVNGGGNEDGVYIRGFGP
jgi:hypothetical protein